MEPIRFRAALRYWNPDKASCLTVAEAAPRFGGLKQQHVEGTMNGQPFGSNVMPAGGGRLAISVSKSMQAAAGTAVGDEAEFEVISVGRG